MALLYDLYNFAQMFQDPFSTLLIFSSVLFGLMFNLPIELLNFYFQSIQIFTLTGSGFFFFFFPICLVFFLFWVSYSFLIGSVPFYLLHYLNYAYFIIYSACLSLILVSSLICRNSWTQTVLILFFSEGIQGRLIFRCLIIQRCFGPMLYLP